MDRPTDILQNDEEVHVAPNHHSQDEKLVLPKYNGKDFSVWKMQLETLLDHKGIGDVLTKLKPRRKLNGTKAEENSRDNEIAAFEKADKYVKSLILLSLDNKEAKLILKCVTARDMWARLCAVHEQKSAANQIILQKEFFELTMQANERAPDFIARAEYLYGQLLDIGVKNVDESVLVGKIVSGLPRRYLNFMSNWASLDSKQQTLIQLIAKLSAEEQLLDKFKKPAENALHSEMKKLNLNSKKKQQQFNKSSNRQKVGETSSSSGKPRQQRYKKCQLCSKRGHLANECRSQSDDKSGGNKEKRAESQIVEGSMIVEEGNSVEDQPLWIVDTGATSHMTFNRGDFDDYREFDTGALIKFGGKQQGHAAGIGTVKLLVQLNGNLKAITLNNVLHVPELRRRLLSVGAATEYGCRGEFVESKLIIKDSKGQILIVADKVNKLYIVKAQLSSNLALVADNDSLTTWHERYCHINKRYLLHTSKVVEGLESIQGLKQKSKGTRDEIDCIGCCFGKQPRKSTPLRETPRATEVGQVVHVDIGGPIGSPSLGGAQYYILFKDEYTNFRFFSVMKSRDEAFDCLRKVVAKIFAESKQPVRHIMTDCGSEFTSKRTQEFLLEQKIVHKTAAPFTPAQNGFIERENRTLMSGVRSMLYHRNLPLTLWGEAANTMVYTLNRSVNRTDLEHTPYELFYGVKPKVAHLRVFGSLALVKTQTKKRSGYQKKIEERAQQGVLVGYEQDFTYRIYEPQSNKIIITRDVSFDENKSYYSTEQDYSFLDDILDTIDDNAEQVDNIDQADNVEMCELEPESYKQAIKSADRDQWIAAMKDEFSSLVKNNTWDLVQLPPGRQAVACRWVYKIKLSTSGMIERYKARLVAKGFTQREGIDYKETFSPVVRLETIRILLVIANHLDLDIVQMDVKTAFLNGELEEEIFMRQPEGFENGDMSTVCRLNRSLYGLKQASLQWNKCFTRFLRDFNLHPLKSDSCVFINHDCNISKKSAILIVCIYVDDGLIMSNVPKLLAECIKGLKGRFEITVNSPDAFVGIQIRRERSKRLLFMSQGHYLKRVLDKFGLNKCTPFSTPMDSTAKFDKNGANGVVSKEVDVPYRQLLGSLLYAACGTRPDIIFSVNTLARFCESPKLVHWNALKRIAKYLKDKEELGIACQHQDHVSLECYSDADYANCVETRKSISGYILLLNGTPVVWKAIKQTIVATSTCEAEFISAATAAKDVVWVRNLLLELGAQLPPTSHNIDNLGAVQLIENNQVHAKTKHLDIKLHYIRDINKKVIKVQFVKTELQLADILTKALPQSKFDPFLKLIKIVDCERMYHSEMNLAAWALLTIMVGNMQTPGLGTAASVGKVSLYINSPCNDVQEALKTVHPPEPFAQDIKLRLSFESYKLIIVKICEMQFSNVLRAIGEVNTCLGNSRRHKRNATIHSLQKRDATDMLEIAGEMIKVGVTNFIQSQYKRSSLMGIGDVGSLFKRLSAATMEIFFGPNTEDKVKDIADVSRTALAHQEETREAVTLIPILSWMESRTQEEMVAGIANLKAVTRYCHNGQLATHEVAEMLGDKTLANVEPSNTLLDQVHVSKFSGSTLIELTFTVKGGSNLWLYSLVGAVTIIMSGVGFVIYQRFADDARDFRVLFMRSQAAMDLEIASRAPSRRDLTRSSHRLPMTPSGTVRTMRDVYGEVLRQDDLIN